MDFSNKLTVDNGGVRRGGYVVGPVAVAVANGGVEGVFNTAVGCDYAVKGGNNIFFANLFFNQISHLLLFLFFAIYFFAHFFLATFVYIKVCESVKKKGFIVLVLLSTLEESVGVSHMRDFFFKLHNNL